MSFQIKDGTLFCEGLKVKDIQDKIPESPFYLYSLDTISQNFLAYEKALDGIPSLVSFAVKANYNLAILRHLQELGSGATLVSGNELKLALAAGFSPEKITYNGNGKTQAELTLAVDQGIMVNIDSEFDLAHINKAATELDKIAKVTIRINPDVDPEVHPYVATGIRDSKFGIRNTHLKWFLEQIQQSGHLDLVGLHCHLGSTIEKVRIFTDATRLMMKFVNEGIQGNNINFQLFIKPHPLHNSSKIKKYWDKHKNQDDLKIDILNQSFEHVLSTTDVLISSYSSTSIESLICGIPTIILKGFDIFDHNPIPNDIDEEFLFYSNEPRLLYDIIQKFLNYDYHKRMEFQKNGEKIRSKYFHHCDLSSTYKFLGLS